MFYYHAYDLNISSSIELPEFPVIKFVEKVDLVIEEGKTPKVLEGPDVLKRARNQSSPGKFLIYIFDCARIYVSNGNNICVEPLVNYDIGLVRNYIRTRALAAAVHQRKWTLLHASAISHNNKAILFLGNSGAGKSTTVGAFVKKGYPFISDDLCIIKKPTKIEKEYFVYPAYPKIRLWEKSIELLNMDQSIMKGNAVRDGIDKYFVTPKKDVERRALPISHIYFLRWSQIESLELNPVDMPVALKYLLDFRFAKNQIDGLGGQSEQFKSLSYLLSNVQYKELNRPLAYDTIWEVRDLLEQDFCH